MSRKQIPQPNFRDALQAFKTDMLANFNCHRIGIIQSFNATNQTATVKIVDKRVLSTYESETPILKDYTLFEDCPVFINSDSFSGFRRPILEGDECLLLFNDRDIDSWFTYGTIGQPNSNRMHSLSDALVIVGFNSKLKSISDFNNSSSSMRYGDGLIEIDADKITIEREETVIELSEKIKFQNAITSLKEIVDNFIDIVTNLKTVNGIDEYPIDPTTAAALVELSTQVGELLE